MGWNMPPLMTLLRLLMDGRGGGGEGWVTRWNEAEGLKRCRALECRHAIGAFNPASNPHAQRRGG